MSSALSPIFKGFSLDPSTLSTLATCLGAAAGYFLPGIRLRARKQTATNSDVPRGGNFVLDVVEEAIDELMEIRLRSVLYEVSKKVDWNTIRLAANRSVSEETSLNQLSDEKTLAAEKYIKSLPQDGTDEAASRDKFVTLMDLQKWVGYRLLSHWLEIEARGGEK